MKLFPDLLFDCLCNIYGKRNLKFVFSYIQKRLIQRKRFNLVCINMEYLVNLPGDVFVDLHSPRNENKLRT